MKNNNKRLIASMVAGISIAITIASLGASAIDYAAHLHTMDGLNKKQNDIYKEFMETQEFSNIVSEQMNQLTEDYVSGKINSMQFRKGLSNMSTIENAKQALLLSNNEFKTQIEDIDRQKQLEQQKRDNSIVPELGLVGFAVGGTSTLVSSLVSSKLESKYEDEKRNKHSLIR